VITEVLDSNDYGAGLYSAISLSEQTVTVENSIITNNYAMVGGEGTTPSLSAPPDGSFASDIWHDGASSLGHNILGSIVEKDGIDATIVATDGDQFGVDPKLLPFSISTSPGKSYFPLVPASPVVNAGNATKCQDYEVCVMEVREWPPGADGWVITCYQEVSPLGVDQLGYSRVSGCDIGPVEAICGDNNIDSANSEKCDDGNLIDGDGCSSTCQIEVCGNGIQEGVEVCDDGNTVDNDGCSADCSVLDLCGNGKIESPETCDDANRKAGDGCSPSCLLETCGNSIVDEGEECDEGDTSPGDGCSPACLIEKCGNSVKDYNEACDDGNVVAGDGCSDICLLEEAAETVTSVEEPSKAAVDEGGSGKSSGGCSLIIK